MTILEVKLTKQPRQAFQQIKQKVVFAITKARTVYFTKKIAENEGNLKKAWQTLKYAINRETESHEIDKLNVILASVSFWPLLIIELEERLVPARSISC